MHITGVDKKPEDSLWASADKLRAFGSLLHEFATPNYGWVHDIDFSSSGDKLAWVSHSSSISFVDGNAPDAPQSLQLAGLPFRCCIFASEDSLIAGGYDCTPVLFQESGGKWSQGAKIDEAVKKETALNSAMAKFKQLDLKNTESSDEGLSTVHQNFITQICAVTESGGKVSSFATAGMDGKLVFWTL